MGRVITGKIPLGKLKNVNKKNAIDAIHPATHHHPNLVPQTILTQHKLQLQLPAQPLLHPILQQKLPQEEILLQLVPRQIVLDVHKAQ